MMDDVITLGREEIEWVKDKVNILRDSLIEAPVDFMGTSDDPSNKEQNAWKAKWQESYIYLAQILGDWEAKLPSNQSKTNAVKKG